MLSAISARRVAVQEAIICKTGPGMTDNAVGKVWGGGVRIIRDEVTEAGKGRVKITARALYDFAVLRVAGFVGAELQEHVRRPS